MLFLRPLENTVFLLRPHIPSGLLASEFLTKFLSIFLFSQACCLHPNIRCFYLMIKLISGKYIYNVLVYIVRQQSRLLTRNLKQFLYKPLTDPKCASWLTVPDSRQSAHKGLQVVSPTHLLPLCPRKYFWYSILLVAESTPGPTIRSGNRTRDFPACSAVPQPTALPRALFGNM
jgi:hypothetical protein